jgi:hypothetical protein
MAFGYDDLILAAILIGDYFYHRWWDQPAKPKPSVEVTLPRTDDGAPYPIVYGRVRIKSPVIAWCDKPISMTSADLGGIIGVADTAVLYFLSQYLILGIPFKDGDQTLFAMWAGDSLLVEDTSGIGSAVALSTLTGTSSDYDIHDMREGHVGQALVVNDPLSGWTNTGAVEFRNGGSTQVLCDVPFGGESHVGTHMATSSTGSGAWNSLYGTIAAADIPGYRGFLSVFLYGYESSSHWIVGPSPSVPQYSFEIRSLPATWLGPEQQVPVHDGDITRDDGDANPMDVLYDLLVNKLGIDPGRIGGPGILTFQAAAKTLYDEGLGFSRCWDQNQTAGEMVGELMRFCEGVIYEDRNDGFIKVKLIRNDYDVASLMEINPSNCTALDNVAMGGWTGIPNKIRATFSNRLDGYRDGSGVAHNQANAVGQDGEVRENTVAFPGCCSQATADYLAARELEATSKPVMKLRARCDRSFRNLKPGDPVKLSWPELGVSGVVFRVVSGSGGLLDNNEVALDLIQDPFYVWRGRAPVPQGAPALSTTAGLFAR